MAWIIERTTNDLAKVHYKPPTHDERIKNASTTIEAFDQSIAFFHELRATALSQIREEGVEEAKQLTLEIATLEDAKRMLESFIDRTSRP